MEGSVTFVVKGTNDYNQVIRCLSSISRQNNPNYNVIVLSDIKTVSTAVKTQFSDYKFIKIDSADDFSEKLNAIVKDIKTKYLTVVNFDEVLAPNTVDYITSENSDIVIFNISKKMKNKKFKSYYSLNDELTLTSYLDKGSTLWNNAISTDIIKKNSIKLNGLSYCQQTLFLLLCYAYSKSYSLTNNVFAYRDKLMAKKPITYKQFKNNRKDLKIILSQFEKRNMNDIRELIVNEFVVAQLKVLYNEKSYIKKIYKKFLIRKYMGL